MPKQLSLKKLIEHIKTDNKSVNIMNLKDQKKIQELRKTFLGASSAPTIFLKGEGCFDAPYEFFCTFTGYRNKKPTNLMLAMYRSGHIMEPIAAEAYQYGEAINQKYDEKNRLSYFELDILSIDKNKQNKNVIRKIHNYEQTLLKTIDDNGCTLGVTLDRLILKNDVSDLLLTPSDYPYLDKPRYALGALECKKKDQGWFKTEEGFDLPRIDLRNRDNINLQYLMQQQLQMSGADLDYNDIIFTDGGMFYIHRTWRDQDLIEKLKLSCIEFWDDAMIVRPMIEKLRLLQSVIDDELIVSEEDKRLISEEIFKLENSIHEYIKKYTHKEFLSDSDYKEMLKMVYIPSDLRDILTDIDSQIKQGKEPLDLIARVNKIQALIERKKELDYAVTELDQVKSEIKANLANYTSLTIFNQDTQKKETLVTYRPNKKGDRTLLFK